MTRWALGLVLLAACGAPPAATTPEEPTSDSVAVPEASAPAPAVETASEGLTHDRLPSAGLAEAMDLPEATAGPVIMRTVALDEGETLELAPSAEHEHFVLVLAGELELAPGEAPGALIRHWYVARARGVPVVLTAVKPSKLVSALVHGESLPKRDVEVINLAEQDQLTWAGGKAHARLGFESGRASLSLLSSHPEIGVPRHAHATSIEVVGLLSGEGTMGIGDERREVASGDVFHMPTGVEHDYAPAGTKTLLAVQLYLPPGPEQRFKEMAKKDMATP